jgi:hypothetical protein
MTTETAIDPTRKVESPVLESSIEAYLVKAWEMLGGKTYKWSSPGYAGVPDRLLFHPRMWGQVVAVEVKAPGKKPTPGQEKFLSALVAMGHAVFVIDSKEAVDTLIADLKRLYRIGEPAP